MKVLAEEKVEKEYLRSDHADGKKFVGQVEGNEVVASAVTTQHEACAGEDVLDAQCEAVRNLRLVGEIPMGCAP